MLQFESGTPIFRIREGTEEKLPTYLYYTQEMFSSDMNCEVCEEPEETREVRTGDPVKTLQTGDVVFSPTSQKAALVDARHDGYLMTKNFYRIIPDSHTDSAYLVYLINEDPEFKKNLNRERSGGLAVVSVSDLKKIQWPKFPSLEIQEKIGQIYLDQKKISALTARRTRNQEQLVLESLRRIIREGE